MSSITMSPSVSRESSAVNWGAFARVGIATVIAAVLANVLVYFIGSALVTYDPEFVVLTNVNGAVIFTLASAIGAVLVYAALLRFSGNPARVFTIISAVVFAVTLIPDFTYIPTVPGASDGQTAILALMHVAAAIVIVRMLTTFTRPQTR